MLLFNSSALSAAAVALWFQNILCYCLTPATVETGGNGKISKHPMLLFNVEMALGGIHPKRFQNILCYCLTRLQSVKLYRSIISKHPMLLFNNLIYTTLFYTSRFQNILCYCLTNVFKPFSQLKSLYTPILHYLIQNYQPANHLFKCVFIQTLILEFYCVYSIFPVVSGW